MNLAVLQGYTWMIKQLIAFSKQFEGIAQSKFFPSFHTNKGGTKENEDL
jgi:hypothetical protein